LIACSGRRPVVPLDALASDGNVQKSADSLPLVRAAGALAEREGFEPSVRRAFSHL